MKDGQFENVWKIRLVVGCGFWMSGSYTWIQPFVSKRIVADLLGATPALVGTCQSMFWIGASVACLVINPLFDIIGRRTPMFVLLGTGLLANLIGACSTSIYMYGVTLFVSGLSFVPAVLANYLLMQESVSDDARHITLVFANTIWGGSGIIYALIGKFTDHLSWRIVVLLFFSPYCFMLPICPFFVSESQAFLRLQSDCNSDSSSSVKSIRAVFGELVSNMRELCCGDLSCTVAATLVCWSSTSLIFYGLTYGVGNLSEDMYANTALLSFVDMLGYAGPFLWKWSARSLQVMSFIGTAVALLSCSFLPRGSYASIACALAGRLFIDFAFTTVYLLVVEHFPMRHRSAATGYANVASRLFTMAAPLTETLPFTRSCAILSVISLAAALATMTLPGAKSYESLLD